MERPQPPGASAGPVRQRQAIKLDPLAGIDLYLTVKRAVVGILGHDHMSDERLGRQPALGQPRQCWRSHHGATTAAASIFRPADHQDAELRSSTSTTTSTRRRCAGNAPRFIWRRRTGRLRGCTAACFTMPKGPHNDACRSAAKLARALCASMPIALPPRFFRDGYIEKNIFALLSGDRVVIKREKTKTKRKEITFLCLAPSTSAKRHVA